MLLPNVQPTSSARRTLYHTKSRRGRIAWKSIVKIARGVSGTQLRGVMSSVSRGPEFTMVTTDDVINFARQVISFYMSRQTFV